MNFSFISVNFLQSSFFNSAHQKRRQIHRIVILHKFEWVVDMIWFFFFSLSSFRLMELKNRVFESNHFRCYYKVLIRIPQRNSSFKKKLNKSVQLAYALIDPVPVQYEPTQCWVDDWFLIGCRSCVDACNTIAFTLKSFTLEAHKILDL